jgi:cytochrome b involved in lipid metabolism
MSVFTLEEVAAHATADDCWIVAHGIVYDVTDYIALHPGGAKAIIRHAGMVCDEDFDFHSPAAQRKVWSKYAIGRLPGTRCAVM